MSPNPVLVAVRSVISISPSPPGYNRLESRVDQPITSDLVASDTLTLDINVHQWDGRGDVQRDR